MMLQFFKKINIAWIAGLIILSTILAYDVDNAYWDDYDKIIYWDVLSYYAYLPAIYIYHDITLSFIDKNPSLYGDKFWPEKPATGRYAIKTTMGLAFLYAPFFQVAHPVARMLGYEANGYSPPYKIALMLSAVFYLAVGLYFLKKVLERYFSQPVTAITLIAVTIGSNLLQYATAEATMPHSYNFALFSVFLYAGMKWHEKHNLSYSIFLGLLSGLIALIRPTNILIIIVFILWGVHDLNTLKERLLLFLKKYHLIAVMAVFFIIVWIPQLIYWKFISGSYWFYSYVGERFFFLHPHIIKGLFGYRKGWLLYTPMMALALIGIGMMYKRLKELFFPVLIFTVLNIYVILSWWSWWYGGGFGLRAFIDSYSLLAIPFAVFVSWALSRNVVVKTASVVLICALMALNIFQVKQYQMAIMHWDSMSEKAYWSIFLKLKQPANFDQLIEKPDIDKAMAGLSDHP